MPDREDSKKMMFEASVLQLPISHHENEDQEDSSSFSSSVSNSSISSDSQSEEDDFQSGFAIDRGVHRCLSVAPLNPLNRTDPREKSH